MVGKNVEKSKEWSKEGQMHTIEALMAAMLVIGVVIFAARSVPTTSMQLAETMDVQLKLYAEDFLNILDMEREDHTSWLYHQVNGTVNGSHWDGTKNITEQWLRTNLNDRGVFCKAEILKLDRSTMKLKCINASSCFGFDEPPANAISAWKLVTVLNGSVPEVYEVRLTVWQI